MVSHVDLFCYDSDGTPILGYTLSPGCTVTKQLNRGNGNIIQPLPWQGLLGIPMGLIEGNMVTVSGQMLYSHNNRKPLTVLEEISIVAIYANTSNNGVQVISGNWHILIQGDGTYYTTEYIGLPKMITYSIAAGEGDICNYTIQMDVTDESTGA